MRTTWMSDTRAPSGRCEGWDGMSVRAYRPACGRLTPVSRPTPRPAGPGEVSHAGGETLPRAVRRQQVQEIATDLGRTVGREDPGPGEAELVDHRAAVA